MCAYHFVEFLVYERFREARRAVEKARLATLAETARLSGDREPALAKIYHLLRDVCSSPQLRLRERAENRARFSRPPLSHDASQRTEVR